MLANRHLAPGFDTTLLKKYFAVVIDDVGSLRLPAKSNKLPPTINLVRSFSSFYGFTSHTILHARSNAWYSLNKQTSCLCVLTSLEKIAAVVSGLGMTG